MGEMIERVAREICVTSGHVPDALDPRTFGADNSLRPQWMNFVEQARAAIAAMREPTYEMVKSGVMRRLGIGSAAELVEAEWQAMIDEALSRSDDTPAVNATIRTAQQAGLPVDEALRDPHDEMVRVAQELDLP